MPRTTHTHLVLALLTLPATILHELTHVAASLPWAERVGFMISPRTYDARAGVEWRDDASTIAYLVAGLAPMCAGLVAACVAAWLWLSSGAGLPSDAATAAQLTIAVANWIVYVVPSADDRATAAEVFRS